MSGLTINSGSVSGHGYQPLDACPAITVKRAPGEVNISTGNNAPQVHAGAAGGEDILTVFQSFFHRLTPIFTWLRSVWGGRESCVEPQVSTVPSPTVQTLPASLPKTDPQESDLPDLSSKRNGAKPDDIWKGFRQGPNGNCVTVSAIKASMAKFGQSPTDIFKEVKKEGEGYRVVMRDGVTLHLSRRELAEGARSSKFVSRDQEMLKDAHFLFAVSAKRAQLENNDGYARTGFRAALHSLNDGEDEYRNGEGLLRLGLKQHITRVPVGTLAKGMVGMVNRLGHSVAVIDGVEEIYGKKGRAPRRGEAIALK